VVWWRGGRDRRGRRGLELGDEALGKGSQLVSAGIACNKVERIGRIGDRRIGGDDEDVMLRQGLGVTPKVTPLPAKSLL
jgi:hypothetical protein